MRHPHFEPKKNSVAKGSVAAELCNLPPPSTMAVVDGYSPKAAGGGGSRKKPLPLGEQLLDPTAK
jgi:hypothetical protein